MESEIRKGKLILEDGTVVIGKSFGCIRSVSGEMVFNTGMVGYPEALTDPSYYGQILVLTFPLVGNYGVPETSVDELTSLPLHFESNRIHIAGLIVLDYSNEHSHWNSKKSLSDWLKESGVPALFDVDTRRLTKKIREKGSILAKIEFDDPVQFDNPNVKNLVSLVSCPTVKTYGKGNLKIMAIDCGMKNNIIRQLLERGVELTVVPWDHDLQKVDPNSYDGLFISNGPGDPMMCWKTVQQLQWFMRQEKTKPLFGICLGNQLLSLAAGAKTFKMKFGNRGMNQPCVDLTTNRCYITPQNHGFAVDNETLPPEWKPFFINANDNTNEGIIHKTKPFFSVQFHPEARGGPTDTEFLFEMFLKKVNEIKNIRKEAKEPDPSVFSYFTKELKGEDDENLKAAKEYKARVAHVKKILLLGSGGLSIGQAGEFDYSGSQAIKALKEEGKTVVLINPNIATCQTSMADKVYYLPLTSDFIEKVIDHERPDAIMLTFGGQTALNCGIQLYKSGVLEKYSVLVLGTNLEAIIATEDRGLFDQKLKQINVHTAPSFAASNTEDALDAAKRIGYPVIVRLAFALGGLGSDFADNEEQLVLILKKAFAYSEQVLVEKSLKGWKEIEYEVVRDSNNNCITVCNMENLDPLGIHTGDSIVVAPSQTLSNQEYFLLRSTAIKVVCHFGIIGECNIQYALDPKSEQFYVIEVNARLSRSSALASKATGYPLAFVAAKIGLGYSLPELKNSVTKSTTACFEPSLDYIVIKYPKWDLNKFTMVGKKIGSEMKSVGEVMAIGRKFEEALQKAIRMVDPSHEGLSSQYFDGNESDLVEELEQPSEKRMFAVAAALKRGFSVDKTHKMSKIDPWFLQKCKNIISMETALQQYDKIQAVPHSFLVDLKKNGFSDKQIANLLREKTTENEIRAFRKQSKVLPFVKQIDTLAAEFPAKTNYLYMTYNGDEHDVVFNDHGVVVLGSGAYRIGSSVEFDWCAVGCVKTLRSLGYKAIMVNYNPETVSTDYDECDRLYFEEISTERVMDIYEIEDSAGVIISVGGQTPNSIALPLHHAGVKILGTSPEMIDMAEDRFKFSKLLDSFHVDQPQWRELSTIEEATDFCEKVGYPTLVRPSYVLSGAAMNVAYNSEDLVDYLKKASRVSQEHPVVISKFITEAKEIEMDAVARGGEILIYAISEHVENAGVHSGDATLVLPAQNLYVETMRRVKGITRKIAKALNISGPFNIQYLAKENDVKVIECNLRASRSFPFVSKVFNQDFIQLATKVVMGIPVQSVQKYHFLDLDYVAIKAPMFSFTRLKGADPVLGVEMSSTGEVACFGEHKYEAFMKALLATGFKIPKKHIYLSLGTLEEKATFLASARKLHQMGFTLYASEGTSSFLQSNDVPAITLYWPSEAKTPNIKDYLFKRIIELVVIVPSMTRSSVTNGYNVRRLAADLTISLITNVKCAKLFVDSLERVKQYEIKPWEDYVKSQN